jgi:hypothetical protein
MKSKQAEVKGIREKRGPSSQLRLEMSPKEGASPQRISRN